MKRGETRLQGFGHRVYKNYDPRARIIKKTADEVFEVTGKNPLLDIALKLEEVALSDDYFVSRKLYPNVDFYSGLIYQAMGFPMEMFTVLFAIPRTAGLAGPLHRAARAGVPHLPAPPALRGAPGARLHRHRDPLSRPRAMIADRRRCAGRRRSARRSCSADRRGDPARAPTSTRSTRSRDSPAPTSATTRRLWRALGFADPGPGDRMGGELDVAVLKLVFDQDLTSWGSRT